MLVRGCWCVGACLLMGLVVAGEVQAATELTAGFAVVDVTPELKPERPIWLAGKELGRAAAGVHDKLYSRAIVLGDGQKRVALVSVDSIGLPNTIVKQVREQLKDIDYVLVASTHSHESPDVIGIWGKDQGTSGVVPEYVAFLVGKITESVRKAAAAAEPAQAFFGTAKDESLLGDFRLPEVYDGVLRTVKFNRTSDNQPLGILVQWNSHGIEPGKNALISRDFMGSTVDALEKRHNCPVVYLQGAVGGLMGTPKKLIAAAKAGKLPTDPFGFIDACGAAVADLADQALQNATPIKLTPLVFATRDIAIPLDNDGYRAALGAGVLKRPVFAWSGDRNVLGSPAKVEQIPGRAAMQTEVAYLKLGELHVAAIPGELYPECVYGQYQEPVDPGADFLDAPLETPIHKILPSDKWLMIGLANDEVGYIVPKRQWDVKPPFAYGRKSSQYGEKNSVGPDTAGELLGALADRVNEAGAGTAPANAAANAERRVPAYEPIVDDPKLPRVLLIGDSISVGYTLPVRELLAGKANVHRIPANGGPTTKGLANIDGWLGKGNWDVIHFNWGLHDVKYLEKDGKRDRQVAPEAYEANLRQLVARLKQTGARLIWCSTTPVPEGAKNREPGDEVKYNEIAARVMSEARIPTDDLYAFALPRLQEIQRKKDVHYSPEGSRTLARQVVRSIETALAAKPAGASAVPR